MYNTKEYHKLYEKNNPEKVKLWHKRYRETHINEIKEYSKKRSQLEGEKERKIKWNKDNPEYSKQYYKNNIEKAREYHKQYYKDNKEKISQRVRKYEIIKMKTDPRYNLNKRISCLIRISLKKGKKGYHWEDLVGYTLNDLIGRLKSTMPKGYTWQDFIKGRLHIDHIVPTSAFNFIETKHIDFKNCWSLENLRLLPAKENLSKHNKLTKPFQPSLAM